MSPLIYTILVTHITIACVTMFLHRSQAHKSVTFSPVVNHFFRFWLWMTTGMVTKEWVAIHRKHHAKCETPEDPHSPVHKGVWNIMFLGVLFYKQEAKCVETLETYGQETPDDWIEKNVYDRHSAKGILLMLIINIYMFGFINGFACWAIQMAWIPFWAAGFINGIGHWFGYRNFASKDTSTNITPILLPIGIIIGGEEFHNNHHAFPRSARLGYHKWEIDFGWIYIKALEKMGLAKVIHATKVPEKKSQAFTFDDKTSLFANKMSSIRKFEKEVMAKYIKKNFKQSAINALKYSKSKILRLLKTDTDAMNKSDSEKYQKIITSDEIISKISDFKRKLEQSWQGVGITVSERMEKMKQWCEEVEKTGHKDIIKFSKYLKRKMGLGF